MIKCIFARNIKYLYAMLYLRPRVYLTVQRKKAEDFLYSHYVGNYPSIQRD